MERYSILDPKAAGKGGAQSTPMPWPIENTSVVETAGRPANGDQAVAMSASQPDKGSGREAASLQFPPEDGGKSLADMAQRDLDATLRLLAERGQYITEATGAAIALCEDDDMVCRASAGSSAPEMGATLQVDSGLTGESVHTRRILYCEDATADARVNRESCQALGIASVIVMPLLRDEEVSGLFELFSNKPHAFTPRDIAALERLGEMVQVALDHAQAARMAPAALAATIKQDAAAAPDANTKVGSVEVRPEGAASAKAGASTASAMPATAPLVASRDNGKEPVKGGVDKGGNTTPLRSGDLKVATTGTSAVLSKITDETQTNPVSVNPPAAKAQSESATAGKDRFEELRSSLFDGPATTSEPKSVIETAAATDTRPAEVSTIRKCAKCGFPISGGRTLCLDCEPKASKPIQAASDIASSADPSAFTPGATKTGISSFFRKPYVVAAFAIALILLVALWFWHSS